MDNLNLLLGILQFCDSMWMLLRAIVGQFGGKMLLATIAQVKKK